MSDDQPLQPPKGPAGLKKPDAGGGLSKPPAAKSLLSAGGGKTLDAPAKPSKPAAPAAPPGAPASSAPLFELDDAPAKPKPKPKAEAAAPAFDPFADQKVSLPLGGSGSGVAEPPPAAAGARAPAPPEDEIDIRPGAAKDLWSCPHCGARNKPSRTSCRDCGKSPSDEVVVPWHRKPKNMAMVAGGVAVLILLYLFATHQDTSLHPAGAADIDAAVRMGGGGKGEREIDGHKFDGKGTLSVSGRMLSAGAHGSAAWVTTVVLVLGRGVIDDDRFASWKVENKEEDFEVAGEGSLPPYVVLYLIFPEGDKPSLTKGNYLSVRGEYGFGENEEGKYLPGSGPGHPHTYTVLVTEHRE
jgi:hypothetical protein